MPNLKSKRVLGFWLPIALLLLVGSGCGYDDVTLEDVSNIKIENASSDGFDLLMDMEFNNPNGYAITIDHADLDMVLNQKRIGKTVIETAIKIPARSTTTQPVNLHTTYDQSVKGNLLELLGVALFAQQIELNATGELKASVFIFSKKIPVNHTEKLSLRDFNLLD